MSDLHVDAGEITTFVHALFRYADSGTYISARAFDQKSRNVPPVLIKGILINGNLESAIEIAIQSAEFCAQSDAPSVFAPPIATFKDQYHARSADLANGLTLSVEIDSVDPDVARKRLESLIGPSTIVIRSGSEWVDPDTGECKPNIHIHWRLSEPTREWASHDKLRQARTIAALLVGADPTGKPVVHPLRWPGTWNLKSTPRIANIATYNSDAEINLGEATERLEDALEAAGLASASYSSKPQDGNKSDAEIEDIRSAMSRIPNLGTDVHYNEWVRFGYALHRATSGQGFDIWDNWSRLSDKYEPQETERTWRRISTAMSGLQPPRTIGAGTIFWYASQNGWTRTHPFEKGAPHEAEEAGQEAPTEEFEATPLSALDLDHIPPRQWIYGRELVRGFVSVLASPGGVGKTAYSMTVGTSVAWGKPLLSPTNIGKVSADCTVHKQGKIWFYNLEDPMEEMRRRIKAIIQHHEVPLIEVANNIFIDSGRDRSLIIAIRAKSGDLIASPIVELLVKELKRRKIDVLVVDPFVQSHSAEENRNEEMNLVMSLWGRVANEAGCAVWLVHHFRKGGKGGDGESVRGAGAIQGAARSMFTLSGMSTEEADKLGVKDDERWQYIRHDNAKQNMAPPAGHAVWMRLANVPLNNATADYPLGDFVQAVEPWTPTSAWSGLPWDIIERILTAVEQGPSPGEFYAGAKQARDRWVGHVLVEIAHLTEGQALSIIKTWRENGVLEDAQYLSPAQKGGKTGCVRINGIKVFEMRQQYANQSSVDE